MTDVVSELMSLFVGNSRSFGRFYPERPEGLAMSTTKSSYEHENFKQHLQGKVGIGVVPILDDGTCRFAAIDIDAHEETDRAIDVAALAERIEKLELPLIACHSKGRGAHCYAFFSEIIPAQVVRSVMQRWAADLGHGGAEIFPKQPHLPKDPVTGNRAYGGWINLPYFAAETRRAVEGGREVTLDYFLDIARTKSMTRDEFMKHAVHEHTDAPPCIQRMMAEGVKAGANLRNNALFTAVVYFRRAFPDAFRQRARDFNATILSKPYDDRERDKTIRSAANRDYSYKCKDEPMVSLCDRVTCMTRRHGVSMTSDGSGDDSLPSVEFTALVKMENQPPRWQLSVNGTPIFFSTGELHSFAMVRQRVFEALHVWIKPVSPKSWEQKLNELSQPGKLEVIQLPEDVSRPGMIRNRLLQYLDKAGPDTGQDGRSSYGASTKPAPQWITYDGANMSPGRYVIFDFNEFKGDLAKSRSDIFKEGIDLHTVLRTYCSCQSIRLKINGLPRHVQAMPAASLRSFQGSADIPRSEM